MILKKIDLNSMKFPFILIAVIIGLANCDSTTNSKIKNKRSELVIIASKARQGDGSAIRKLFSVQDIEVRNEIGKIITCRELFILLKNSAVQGDPNSQILLFEYCFIHKQKRFEGWQELLRKSFLGGNSDAAFLLLLFDKTNSFPEYRFDKDDLDLVRTQLASQVKSENNPFSNELEITDFLKVFSITEDIDQLNGLELSNRAQEIIITFHTMKNQPS